MRTPPAALPSFRPEDAVGAHRPVRLEDYTPPAWLVDRIALDIALDPAATRVTAKLTVRRNPQAAGDARPDFALDGKALKLLEASIDGAPVEVSALTAGPDGLVAPAALLPESAFAGESFEWRAVTQINPRDNTALEGLYMSRDMFCSQCEAEGFRKITYFPDRPDVMSVYEVRIEADKTAYPVLLSNGEPIDQGDLRGGRHFVTWRDPWPKPCYLFALVAGDLSATNETFTTRSGRRVMLSLFTRKGDEAKSSYALDALKRSMAWDETEYGREYDLDLFMIVAVDDFNMGAMENKGLNVFNSKYVLASPETATDKDYELIESVVAHEYFHNWTGNRITCRDWFQLCLKEGLTVFRDQQFSEDMRSAAVQRIDSVRALRARQFREDAGPLAHPVRPESYVEINNFYTATVYEKGAEIVRMLRTIFGPEIYRAALDLYFERHDGRAATLEDFVSCFADAGGVDLAQFALWWSQAGTPRVRVEERYDPRTDRYRVSITQSTPPTPGQPEKAPMVIPLRYGLLREDGSEILTPEEEADPDAARDRRVLVLDAETKSFEIGGLGERPTLSLNRGFSAPVIIERDFNEEALALLSAHDPDPFNRWEAGRRLAIDLILGRVEDLAAGRPPRSADAVAGALARTLQDDRLDPAFQALALTPPGEEELAGEASRRLADDGETTRPVDPQAIHDTRRSVREDVARALSEELSSRYEALGAPAPYSPDEAGAARRALRNAALSLLCAAQTDDAFDRAAAQFAGADNMTDQLASLGALAHHGAPQAEAALDTFFRRWRGDPLVLGKWFGVQATNPSDGALERVSRLTRHPDFEWKNPNKFRALIGAFAMGNPSRFHQADGAGYKFVADWLIRLDPVNPQTAAKLVTAFESWRIFDAGRQKLMRAELERVAATPKLSRDVSEMATRMLG